MRDDLMTLLDAAEAGGIGSLIALMGVNANRRVAQDIPVASEVFGLLRHFGEKLPYRSTDGGSLPLEAGIFFHAAEGRIVALIPINARELDLVAYWLSQGIQSEKLVALPGLLALPFTIEKHDGQRWLIPEWFALFYVDASAEHCAPVLALQSVLDDGRFSDWVPTALARAASFGLPTAAAVEGADRVLVRKASVA